MIHYTKRFLPNNVAKSENNMYEEILYIQVSPILFYNYFGKNAQNALFIKKSNLSTVSNYAQLSSLLNSKREGKSFLLQLLLLNYSANVCQLSHSCHFTWNYTSLCAPRSPTHPALTALASNNNLLGIHLYFTSFSVQSYKETSRVSPLLKWLYEYNR